MKLNCSIAPLVIAILWWTVSLPVLAQFDQGGYLAPGDSLQSSLPKNRNIYIPRGGFSLYESPGGEFKAKILSGPPLDYEDQSSDSLLTATLSGNQIKSQLLSAEHFLMTFDSCFYVPFVQKRDSFLLTSVNDFQGWLSIEEVEKDGFELVTWIEFFNMHKNLKIYPLKKMAPILNKPSDESEAFAIADELFSEITTTGKCNGAYCLAQIVQFKNPYDPTKSREENTLRKYKGWIKVVDEEGQRLVAHQTQ